MPVAQAQQKKPQGWWDRWGKYVGYAVPLVGIAAGAAVGARMGGRVGASAGRRAYSGGRSRFWEDWDEAFRNAGQRAGGHVPPPGTPGGWAAAQEAARTKGAPPRFSVSQAHDILGVKPGIGKDDLKKAYRDMAKQYHTDKGVGSQTKIQDINEAWDTLWKGHYKYGSLLELGSFLDAIMERL